MSYNVWISAKAYRLDINLRNNLTETPPGYTILFKK
jgi:hypothetical protein